MRFRRFKFAFSGDISKMYRQVAVAQKQWNLQRIFWRKNSNERLKEYCLVVVTYGLASSPYVTVRAMVEGANEFKEQFPEAVRAIKEDFYMDDCATGANTEHEAIQLAKNMRNVLAKSCFDLRKWRSNSANFIKELSGDCEQSVTLVDPLKTSILVLKWYIIADEFTYEVKAEPLNEFTKRKILSTIGQIYDPNGFIEPFIVTAKVLVQKLWQLKLGWDDSVPKEIVQIWNSIWKPIKELEKVRIPRWLNIEANAKLQLHGFADASTQAYGGGMYLRAIQPNGDISCRLIASKSRVAPIKTVTIPRLELAAADLLGQLLDLVRNSMELQNLDYFLWSDSMIALHWINKPVHELKIFVGNRVKRITKNSESKRWQHVRTHDNPADLISRGLTANEIIKNPLWWNGSYWLCKPQEQWPEQIDWRAMNPSKEMECEMKVNIVSIVKTSLEVIVPEQEKCLPLLEYSENLNKLANIAAFVFRFVRNCQRKVLVERMNKKQLLRLTSSKNMSEFIRKNVQLPSEHEKSSALKYFIKQEQALEYAAEFAYFANRDKRHFPERSKLLALKPFMDEDGLLRVGGRLSNATIPYDTKHPLIVPPGSRMCELIIADAHFQTFHGAISVMMQYIRATYWIPRLRNELRSYVHKCSTCARFAKKTGKSVNVQFTC